MRVFLDLAVGYFPQFAIASAICLGHWVAVVLDDKRLGRCSRWLGAVALSAFFLVAPAKSRPLALPLAVSWNDPPVTALEDLAADIGRLIPRDARVFHLGGPLGLYLAGIDPYLRQERGLVTLVATADDGRFARSGLWDLGDIRKWLTRDSDYAVIAPAVVEPFRGTTLEPGLALVDSLLSTHFVPVGVVRHYPASVYYVYRRAREPGR